LYPNTDNDSTYIAFDLQVDISSQELSISSSE